MFVFSVFILGFMVVDGEPLPINQVFRACSFVFFPIVKLGFYRFHLFLKKYRCSVVCAENILESISDSAKTRSPMLVICFLEMCFLFGGRSLQRSEGMVQEE